MSASIILVFLMFLTHLNADKLSKPVHYNGGCIVLCEYQSFVSGIENMGFGKCPSIELCVVGTLVVIVVTLLCLRLTIKGTPHVYTIVLGSVVDSPPI